MRLFFIGWSGKDLGLTEVVRKLKEKHEIVYWSGDGSELEILRSEFPDTIFHDGLDALNGIPARGVDVSLFLPPDEKLLARLLDVESTVLTMMNKRFEGKLVSERKHLYYHFVQYWNGVLMALKPDAIIFSSAPHTVYDYVIYGIAKLLSIKTIFFELTAIGARSLSMRDFVVGSGALRKDIADNAEKSFEISDLETDIREYYEWQLNEKVSHVPTYMTKQFNRYSGLNKLPIKFRSLWLMLTVHKDLSVLAKIFTYLPRHLTRNMKTEYASVKSLPDFAKKFIYAPLNYQPERTSSPQGGVFVDQLMMMEVLSASVPSNCLIYVKEHPAQWLHRGPDFFSYRYRGFYKEIAKLRNVRVVPVKTDTYTLMKRSIAVATVTGTAGWESILRSKPAVVFGYPWYQHAPGVLKVIDVTSCREAVRKILSGFAPSGQQIINYLASFGRASFLGYCESHGKEIDDIGVSRNADVIVSAIETELGHA